jgi:hypothetical protein
LIQLNLRAEPQANFAVLAAILAGEPGETGLITLRETIAWL